MKRASVQTTVQLSVHSLAFAPTHTSFNSKDFKALLLSTLSLCTYVIIILQKSNIFLRKTMKLRKCLPCNGYMAWFPHPKKNISLLQADWTQSETKAFQIHKLLLTMTSTLYWFFSFFWYDCCISWPLALITTILELNINATCIHSKAGYYSDQLL